MTNKEKAVAMIQAFETGSPKVMDFLSDQYIQHNLEFPDGNEVITGFFAD